MKDFLAILPTQTYAASAYQKGRIEFLIIRQGQRGVDIVEGLNDPLTDWSEDQKGINFTARFTLAFTKDKKALYELV